MRPSSLWKGVGEVVGVGKPTVRQRQLNCSYLHHNVKGVLVGTGTQEANTQVTFFLFLCTVWQGRRSRGLVTFNLQRGGGSPITAGLIIVIVVSVAVSQRGILSFFG